jgi:fibronectin-binding autotransporter adhesin
MGNAANKLVINGTGSVGLSNVGAPQLSLSNAIDVNANFRLTAGSSVTLSGSMNLGNATRTITMAGVQARALNGVISNGGLALVVDSGTFSLGGANTFSGDTTVSGTVGVVNLTNSLALQNSTLVYGNSGGSVAFNGITAATFGGLSGDKALVLSNTAAAAVDLSVGNNNASTTYSGVLSGAGGLTKLGLGTLVVSGSNTYLGNTVVSVGALLVNGNQSSASGAVSVASGATLGGSGTLGGAVSILAGGIVAPGNSPGTLTVNNTFTLAGASILNFELNAADTTVGGGINDLITGVTDLTLDGILNLSGAGDWTTVADNTSWRLFNYTGTLSGGGLTLGSTPTLADGRSFQIDTSTTGQVNVVVVPEPSAVLLALGGVAYLIGSARRRTSRRR